MTSYKRINLALRMAERAEIITGAEAKKYADRRDNRALTTRLVALDILEKIPQRNYMGNVLEVCCGTGDLASELQKFTGNRNIYATDGSSELIKFAKKRHPNIRFGVESVYNHSNKATYDLVICKDAFHHFFEPDEGLNALLDCVVPGGFLYIFDLNRGALSKEASLRLEAIKDSHEKRRFLQSLNASWTVGEFTSLVNPDEVDFAATFYPFHFSKNALAKCAQLLAQDKTREYEMHTLFSVYVLQRKR